MIRKTGTVNILVFWWLSFFDKMSTMMTGKITSYFLLFWWVFTLLTHLTWELGIMIVCLHVLYLGKNVCLMVKKTWIHPSHILPLILPTTNMSVWLHLPLPVCLSRQYLPMWFHLSTYTLTAVGRNLTSALKILSVWPQWPEGTSKERGKNIWADYHS